MQYLRLQNYEYKLKIEFDECNYTNRNFDEETKSFDISMVMKIIRRQIKKSSKRSLIDRILEKLLELQFQSNY